MEHVMATVKIDVSEAVKGLKQLQREARKTAQVLRQVEQAHTPHRDFGSFNQFTYNMYLSHVLELCGEGAEPRYINRQLFDAILNDDFYHLTIHYHRCDGATTSAVAALRTFDDVAMIKLYKSWDRLYPGVTIYGLDEPLRGHTTLNSARVIILDDRITLPMLLERYAIRPNQRTITLYGHE
jgi:hypothetical protein